MLEENRAYKELLDVYKEIKIISSVESVMYWDNRTYMPKAASAYRGEQISYLAGVAHQKRTDSRIGSLLQDLDAKNIDRNDTTVVAVNLREWWREYNKSVKLPQELVEERSRTAVEAQAVWIEARSKNDFAMFKPWLQKTVDLCLRTAEYLGYENEPYDAMLDDYEPGASTENTAETLTKLCAELVPLIKAIGEAPRQPDTSILKRNYPIEAQRSLVSEIARSIGYSFDSGRLDETTHPFCSGLGPSDARITTRYDENFINSALFGVIHEAGHGIYEQNQPKEHYGSPMGDFVSLGIHESQSRMWENVVGRSNAFWEYWYPKAQEYFPHLQDVSLDDFHFAINAVSPSYIRVEADEITYNLHIMLRFELERAMSRGELKVDDVPAAWNEKFKEYLGIDLPDDTNGCLQDIHWSGGDMGYFPTYSLGNLYAAQMYEKALDDLGDLDADFRVGNFLRLKDWLTENVHKHGKRYNSSDLIRTITGKSLSAEPLVKYLKSKFEQLYNL
ncbi:MAG: carboxypeptidase M32 [Candidatus Hatepunaea meridiana]|nr:carboxypeptidase M32 [Candidatus Hatepunaea meridiana]